MTYYPIQIPFLLNETYRDAYCYREVVIAELADFVICIWSMQGQSDTVVEEFTNIIVPDGCIDLVVDFTNRHIVCSGMSQIEYDVVKVSTEAYFGLRMKPGAFALLFDCPALEAMDQRFEITDIKGVFDGDFAHAQSVVIAYLVQRLKQPDKAMRYFDDLYASDALMTIEQISLDLAMSTRQVHRFFMFHFGVRPKLMLDIIRFQKSLKYLLEDDNLAMADLALQSGYFDQAHFSKDIKKNIGISPSELIRIYKES